MFPLHAPRGVPPKGGHCQHPRAQAPQPGGAHISRPHGGSLPGGGGLANAPGPGGRRHDKAAAPRGALTVQRQAQAGRQPQQQQRGAAGGHGRAGGCSSLRAHARAGPPHPLRADARCTASGGRREASGGAAPRGAGGLAPPLPDVMGWGGGRTTHARRGRGWGVRRGQGSSATGGLGPAHWDGARGRPDPSPV